MNTSVQNINKITLQPLQGQALIDAVARDDLYKSFLSFTSPKDIQYAQQAGLVCYQILQDNISVGFIGFKLYTDKLVEFHGGVYKKYRGSSTPRILEGCFDYLRKINDYDFSFITIIPASNIAAITLVQKCNFKHQTTIPNATRDGSDLLMFVEK